MKRRLDQVLGRVLFEYGGAVALAILILYIWIAPPHIVDGDNAELSTLGLVGGAAHPSGYPLYLIWLRIMSWLPAQSPAHAAAIATVILGVAQIMILHAACRAWGARAIAASFAVAIFAGAPVVMRMYTQAEVFALNGLIAATVLWLAAQRGPLRGESRAAALGLVAGLGLANHLTCVLLAPIGILGVVRGIRESKLSRPSVIAVAILGLAIGLVPYAYLAATHETQTAWGAHLDSFAALVRHFMRSDYGGPGYSGRAPSLPAIETLTWILASVGRAWLWIPLGVGIAALAVRVIRDGKTGESRFAWLMLLATLVVSGPLFALRLKFGHVGLGIYAAERFYLLPSMLMALPVAIGFDRGWSLLSTKLSAPPRHALALGSLLATAAFITAAAMSLPYVGRVHTPALEQGVKNMLLPLPTNAVVIVALDQYTFGLGYLQAALGERPDVTVISWPQAPLAGYRDRLATRSGIRISKQVEGAASVDVADQVLAAGRPLFIDGWELNIAKTFPTYPFGLLFRVIPRHSALPPIEDVFAINKSLFDKLEFGYPFPDRDSDFASEFHSSYAQTWRIIQDALERRGKLEDAAYAREMVKALAPTP
ncbi:MAG: hypothetical protein JWO36_7242 [Myxococcales bacterium]|nr:hypothetical protein [Myxococcales bacterium]